MRIEGYSKLPDDWDTYGAGPVGREVVEKAIEFARWISWLGVSEPNIGPDSSGSILFEWLLPDRALTAELAAGRGFSFSYEVYDRFEKEGDFRDFLALLQGELPV